MTNQTEKEKRAVEILSSPEQLDQLLYVIQMRWRVTLFTLIVLVALIIIWSSIGTILVTVDGRGITYNPSGDFLAVSSEVRGKVSAIHADYNSIIEKDKAFITLTNPRLDLKLRAAEESYRQYPTPENQRRLEILKLEQKALNITPPKKGRLIKMNVVVGDIVKPGDSLAWLEIPATLEGKHQVYAFVPLSEAQEVKPDMNVNLTLVSSGAKVQGKVAEVLPVMTHTPFSWMRASPSDALIKYLKQNPVAKPIIINLDSHKELIRSGELVEVEVVVQKKHPISYLLDIKL